MYEPPIEPKFVESMESEEPVNSDDQQRKVVEVRVRSARAREVRRIVAECNIMSVDGRRIVGVDTGCPSLLGIGVSLPLQSCYGFS